MDRRVRLSIIVASLLDFVSLFPIGSLFFPLLIIQFTIFADSILSKLELVTEIEVERRGEDLFRSFVV